MLNKCSHSSPSPKSAHFPLTHIHKTSREHIIFPSIYQWKLERSKKRRTSQTHEGEFTKAVWVGAMVSRLSKGPAGILLADISDGGGCWTMAAVEGWLGIRKKNPSVAPRKSRFMTEVFNRIGTRLRFTFGTMLSLTRECRIQLNCKSQLQFH